MFVTLLQDMVAIFLKTCLTIKRVHGMIIKLVFCNISYINNHMLFALPWKSGLDHIDSVKCINE